MTGCDFPAVASAVRFLPPGGPVMSRFVVAALDAPTTNGVRLCADHVHAALDYHLMSLAPALPEPGKPERRT